MLARSLRQRTQLMPVHARWQSRIAGQHSGTAGVVRCDRSLYLTGSGTIPDALGQLTNLQSLILSPNGFRGSIPTSLSALTALA